MTEIIIKDVAPEIVEKLTLRAQRNRRPLEEEVRIILEAAVWEPAQEGRNRQTEVERIRALFAGRAFEDSATLLREDRDK